MCTSYPQAQDVEAPPQYAERTNVTAASGDGLPSYTQAVNNGGECTLKALSLKPRLDGEVFFFFGLKKI